MLREDKNARVVKLPPTLLRVFTGRYALASGKRTFDPRWKRARLDALMQAQAERPVALVRVDRRVYWIHQDAIYWEDDDLDAEDVKALIHQRQRKRQRQLQNAHSLMRAEEGGHPTRAPIPTEIRRAVFERDGGRCVECDSNFDLQYDHVLPVALGGASTVENLQLLCADCNRRKGASI